MRELNVGIVGSRRRVSYNDRKMVFKIVDELMKRGKVRSYPELV